MTTWAELIDQANMSGNDYQRKRYIQMRNAGKDPSEALLDSKRGPQQLANGMYFNQNTGEVFLPGDEGKKEFYYNPFTNSTSFGDEKYTGRYDPYIFSSITEDYYKQAEEDPYVQAYLERQMQSVEKNPFIIGSEINAMDEGRANSYADKQYMDALSPVLSGYNSLLFNKAYGLAEKNYQGSTFYDQLQEYINYESRDKTKDPGYLEDYADTISGREDLSEEVKRELLKYAGKKPDEISAIKAKEAAQQKTDASRQQAWRQATSSKPYSIESPNNPVASYNALEAPDIKSKLQPQSVSAPVAVTQPSTPSTPTSDSSGPESLDWKALYDKISGYFDQNMNKSVSKPREQMTNYYDYGIKAAGRQSYYNPATPKSSTPYSGKGA